jgi:hypothetical protein
MANNGPLGNETNCSAIDEGTLALYCSNAPVTVGLIQSICGDTNSVSRNEKMDLLRLQQIRCLVASNNKSKMSSSMVICQIYKESKFDQYAGTAKAKYGKVHAAKGLMQLQLGAISQVLQNDLESSLGHKVRADKPDEMKAFNDSKKNAKQLYDVDIVDEATNIRYGTQYLQYLIDKAGSEKAGYELYRGPQEPGEDYYGRIKSCASLLDKDPNNVKILYKLHGK